MEIIELVGELAPTLMKYSEINPELINIKVYNFDNGAVNIKINSDKPEVGEALTELLLLVAKISEAGNTKVNVEVN
jgi:hypothetical protein